MAGNSQPASRHIDPASAGWLRCAATVAVFNAFETSGWVARAVGGTVRNALLGLPVSDIDIATPANPEQVMTLAKAAGLKVVPTGIEHGTVTIISEDRAYEVTTLRRDVTTDGRRATVAFTDDWHLDASRRDFTMNALYADRTGHVFDPLCGIDDLESGRVRFIGRPDDRIAEDYLRILRFFRFSATYATGLFDRDGLDACARGRPGLASLSAERVWSEFRKTLEAHRASEAVAAMYDWGILTHVIATAPRIGRYRSLLAAELQAGLKHDSLRGLATLAVHSFGDPQRLKSRLRLANQEAERLSAMTRPLPPGATINGTKLGEALYRNGATTVADMLLLAAADRLIEYSELQSLLNITTTWQPPVFPLGGGDLVALGLTPGPDLGRLLDQLEQYWIDHDFRPSRADLAALAENKILG